MGNDLKNFVLKRSMFLAMLGIWNMQLATVASIRKRERRLNRTIEEGQQYQDYNWSDLIESGKLSELKVKELDDKYLKEHQLPSAGKKPDYLKRITADFYLRNNMHKEATSEDKPADPE